MIRFKDVKIPNPCSINYDSLPYNEVKRFCDSCEKQVYDFRGKEDNYFAAIFQQERKNLCGIFYEDQLSHKKSNSKKTLPTSFFIKLIGLFLFIRSLFIPHDTKASSPLKPEFSQTITNDSVGVKLIYKKVSRRIRHHIEVYVNNKLIISTYPTQEFIYLPDTLKQDDKIKIKVIASNNTIKRKTYRFKYSDAEQIKIKITKRKNINLFKRRSWVGCPKEFW